MARGRPQPQPQPRPRPTGSGPSPGWPPDDDEPLGPRLGETLRRLALGLTAALVVSRAFWAPEGAWDGNGRAWILLVLATAAVAVTGALVAGAVRLRFSATDLAVLILVALVAYSSHHAADKRPALNLAWEWIALGVVYLLARNLPRTPGESSALAACLAATAVALSAYGLAQVAVEFPLDHAEYLRNPAEVLAKVGLDPKLPPGSPERKHFEDRFLGSNEPFATFALANSLAGFLVGPAVLGLALALDRLRNRDGRPPLFALLLGAVPYLVLLTCLLLTKSRSAYLGLLVGGIVVVAQVAGSVPRKWLIWGGGGLLGTLALLVTLGVATRQLDLQVLTESTKSLRYRLEYWRATTGVLGERGTWWSGVGPGNFGRAYLKHKLPESSEEIADPHNLILDVWASSGFLAALALLSALALAARDLFGRSTISEDATSGDDDPIRPPAHAGWLVACGFAGWALAWPLGGLNPFQDRLILDALPLRWLVLALAWGGAILLARPLWGRRAVPAWGLGAAALAVVVNLLAAGGIAFPSVALALWLPIALGLNLRADRRCGRRPRRGGYVLAFVLAAVLAALIGWFFGAVYLPTSASQARLEEARAAMKRRPPDLDAARRLYHDAADLDRYDPNPWIELALFDLSLLDLRREVPSDKEIQHIANHLATALDSCNPNSYHILMQREQILNALLDRLAGAPNRPIVGQLKQQRLDTLRRSATLYPTNTTLRARLAVALAEAGALDEAARQAQEALRLDDLNPHAEKKLPDRDKLEADVQRWSEATRPRPPER